MVVVTTWELTLQVLFKGLVDLVELVGQCNIMSFRDTLIVARQTDANRRGEKGILPGGRQERDLRHAADREVPGSNFQKCLQEVPNAIL